jgi:hypothetical protein
MLSMRISLIIRYGEERWTLKKEKGKIRLIKKNIVFLSLFES